MDNQLIEYLKGMEQRLDTKIDGLRTELKDEIKREVGGLRVEFKDEIKGVHDYLKGELASYAKEQLVMTEAVAKEISQLQQRLRKVELTLENDVADKIRTLYSDGYHLVYDKTQALEKRVEILEKHAGIL